MRQLSGVEKQFWLASRMHPQSSAYNIAACVCIEGVIDKDLFRKALSKVFFDTEVFHSAYRIEDDTPMVYVDENISLPYQEIACPSELVFSHLDKLHQKPFRLDEPPLVRFALIQTDIKRHYFLLVMHHIVTDLRSKQKISGAISAIYNRNDPPVAFGSYSSFNKIQADYFCSKKGKQAISYWKEKMDCESCTLELPSTNSRQPLFKAEGSSVDWTLPSLFLRKLKKLEANNEGQIFLWLLTTYSILLARLSRLNRFFIGVPLTNRRLEGTEDTLGVMVNILPVNVDINSEDTFTTLYEKLRKEMLFNHRYQEIPFTDIASFYKGNRANSRPHLIQAGFTLEPLFTLDLDNVTCKSIPIKRKGSQMDLFFTYWPDGDGFSGCWEYNSDLLDEKLVIDWLDCFNTLLGQTLAHPEYPLKDHQILSQTAQKRIARFNSNTKSYPLDQTISKRLRNAFSKHRNCNAIIDNNRRFSYADMEEIVCRAASQLHTLYGQKNRIALLLSQSPEMVFTIHSVVQSGNAYVPLGTDWPEDRIRMVIEDIEPVAVITEKKYESIVSSLKIPVIQATSLIENGTVKAAYPDLTVGPEDSAYIIYTSGSTGKPKGAELPHKGVLNRILWMQDEYRLTPQDRVLQKTPYTFDVSVWEFLWPFFAGAALVITKPDGNKDPIYLKNVINDQQISVLHFVPSLLSIFLKVPGVATLTSLRDIICSGEALTKRQEEDFFKTFQKTRLHNLYGPTEASIDVTYWECGTDAEKDSAAVPIGLPIANTQLYIVDQNDKLCPPHVTGELLIGGVGLAKGYWNRHELTREKFIPNPFGSGRLYRTGDLARYRLDGVIEYIGRNDFQVKLRGLRVELGEIETAMENHPSIDRAVVDLWRRSETDERLVGYYTCQDKAAVPANEDLVALLEKTLPDYMIPGHFLLLEQMPINANGKLDRKALPIPEVETPNSLILPPENETQNTIHNLWKEILSGGQFGIDDNFFDVGGSSLTIMELGLKLERAFGKEVGVLDLFRHPTIKGMSTLFEQKSSLKMTDQKSRADAHRKRLKKMQIKRKYQSNTDQ